MTQKDFHKGINKQFYEFVNENYPDYHLDFNEQGGRVMLYLPSKGNKHYITYHQREHYCLTYSDASQETKEICENLNKYLDSLLHKK